MEEKIFNECLTRMEMLNLSKQCINAFKQGKVWESERIGALYEVNEEEQKIINTFEREHQGYKVYHMIHSMPEFGELYSILYVSTEEEEWKQDKQDIQEGYPFVYVYNKSDNYCSEFGSVTIKKVFGGLIRLY